MEWTLYAVTTWSAAKVQSCPAAINLEDRLTVEKQRWANMGHEVRFLIRSSHQPLLSAKGREWIDYDVMIQRYAKMTPVEEMRLALDPPDPQHVACSLEPRRTDAARKRAYRDSSDGMDVAA